VVWAGEHAWNKATTVPSDEKPVIILPREREGKESKK
jgi:hypothetical protein